MKTISFTMSQLEYIFNFGTTFKFDRNKGEWMEDIELAFGELYDTTRGSGIINDTEPRIIGTTELCSKMDETCIKLMLGAMVEEARKLGDIVKCSAMRGGLPVIENDSLIMVSTIINQINIVLN